MASVVDRIESLWDDVHVGTLEDDTFDHIKTVHDWRNHVPSAIQFIWPNLTRKERMIVAITADGTVTLDELNEQEKSANHKPE